MKNKKNIVIQSVFILVIIGIAFAMYHHVTSVKENLENIQTDLIYVEAGRMTREETTYLKHSTVGIGESSESIHPEGAYLFAAPYIIIDMVLIIVYIVRYRT